jgi:hypothetical protein
MANRNFTSQRLYTMHAMVVSIDMSIAIGAAGAPTLAKTSMVSSVTRTAAGTYLITLADKFNGLISASNVMQSPTTGLSGVTSIEMGASTINSVIVQTLNSTGVAADPATGSTMKIDLKLLNSVK